MWPNVDQIRLWAIPILWVAGFAVVSFFYGVGYNQLFLTLAIACVILAIIGVGPSALLQAILRNPVAILFAILVLVLLVAHHIFKSHSPENSFAATWQIALLPLWFLVAVAYPSRHRLLLAASIPIVLIALIAAGRFLLFGQRAYDPFSDSNLFAALMYLCWIPFAHAHLSNQWASNVPDRFKVSRYLIHIVFLLALYATASRAALIFVVCAFLGWLLLVWRFRMPARPVLLLVVVAILTYLVFWLRTPSLGASVVHIQEIVSGVTERQVLWSSAWKLFLSSDWFGTGIFTFPLLYAEIRTPIEQLTTGYFVHNDYLQFLLEGGIPFASVLAILVATVAYRILKPLVVGKATRLELERMGWLFALAALLVHANLNFVFYSAKLNFVVGLVFAFAFYSENRLPQETSWGRALTSFVKPTWLGFVVFGIFSWGYLVLDTYTVGVFQGQPSLPSAQTTRKDPIKMLQFARFAQEVNTRRSMPFLGDAMISARILARSNDSTDAADELLRVSNLFERAIEMDPYGVMAYREYGRFLVSYPAASERSSESLLRAAIDLDPTDLSSIRELVRYYDGQDSTSKSYQLMKHELFPWFGRHAVTNHQSYLRMFDDLMKRAVVARDLDFIVELKNMGNRNSNVKPPVEKPWFIQQREALKNAAG